MKSKCSFILKASTALVLALLMLFGSITTVIGATAGTAKGDSALTLTAKKVVDIAKTGAKADLAETGAINKIMLAGSFNGWSTTANTATSLPARWDIVFSSTSKVSFKVIFNDGSDHWCGITANNDGTYSTGNSTKLYWGQGGNIQWTPESTGTFSFTFSSDGTDNFIKIEKKATPLTPLGKPTLKYNNETTSPVTISGSTANLTWEAITGAGSYSVTNSITGETFAATSPYSVTPGKWTVIAKPASGSTTYSDSPASNEIELDAKTTFYIKKSLKDTDGWTKLYLYLDDNNNNSTWPGDTISTSYNDDYYKVELTKPWPTIYAILNKGSGNDQTGNMDTAFTAGGSYIIDSATKGTALLIVAGTPAPKYNVTFTPSSTGGTVKVDNSSTSPVKVAENTDFTILAKPNTGYTVDTVKVGTTTLTAQSGGSDSAGYTYTYNVGNAAKTVTATFKKVNYTVTLNKNADSATAGTESVTATYGDAMPSATMPTRTGYTFEGYYDTDATSGGNMYYKADGTSNKNWDKTANTTLYARWTEVTGTVKGAAYTSGSASTTGGTVDNTSITVGIATSKSIKATTEANYSLSGWQITGTNASHLKYRFGTSDAWTAATKDAVINNTGTTIYIQTDGTSGITTSNAEVCALFVETDYTGLTVGAQYTEDGSTYTDFATTPSGVTIAANHGTNQTGVAVTAPGPDPDGYVFDTWYSANGGFDNAANKDTTFKPNAANAKAIARYKKIYTISASVDATGTGAGEVSYNITQGSIAGTGNENKILAGGSYTITATAKSGSAIESIKITKGTTTNTYTDNQTVTNVSADQTVVVKFKSNITIRGNSTIGTNWDSGDAMTSNADGTEFTKAYTNVAGSSAGTSYEFKLHDGSTFSDDSSATVTITGGESTGTMTTKAAAGVNWKLTLKKAANVTIKSDGTKITEIKVVPADATKYKVTFKMAANTTITGSYEGTNFTTAEADAEIQVYSGDEISFTVTADSGKYISSLTTSAGSLSPAFAAGDSYTGKIDGVTSAITVTPAAGDKLTVTAKSNKAARGTVSVSPESAYPGQTVTITVSPKNGILKTLTYTYGTTTNTLYPTTNGTNSVNPTAAAARISDLASVGAVVGLTAVGEDQPFTLTMPSSAVTVNAVFDAYSGESTWYYNGYDDSGNALSGYHGKQMTEGMVSGEKFSYYHVEGRTGDDQLMTVSDGVPSSGTRYVYFVRPNNYGDGWSASNNPKAHFWKDGGSEYDTWPGNEMSWQWNNDYGQGVYKIAIPEGADRVSFNDATNNGQHQTLDIDLTNTSGAYYVGEWNSTYSKYEYGTWDTGWADQGWVASGTEYFYQNSTHNGDYTGDFNTKGFYNHNASDKEFAKPKDLGSNTGDYYINVLYPNTTYTINGVTKKTGSNPMIIWSTEPLAGDDETVTVYAKDGAIRSEAYGSTYANIADTKIYLNNETVGTKHSGNITNQTWETYKAAKGDTIVIKTQIGATDSSTLSNAADLKAKYYVRGFCVNGEVSKLLEWNADGLYTLTYKVPEDDEDLKKIEITPIYYLKDTNANPIVTYRVTGFTDELKAVGTDKPNWGDTLYTYPFYGKLGSNNNALGAYPGQPMVYYKGQYQMQIPQKSTAWDIYESDSALNGATGDDAAEAVADTSVSGVTMSNGYYDIVHRQVMGYGNNGASADHVQTYDYGDFYKIFKEKSTQKNPVDNIVFDFKYRTKKHNFENQPAASITKSTLDTDYGTNGNGFELLTNFHGRTVDLFGTPLSGDQLNATPVYVISIGGVNGSKGVENIAGYYATEWMVYGSSDGTSYSRISAGGKNSIPPEVLVLNDDDTTSFNTTTYPSADANHTITDWEALYTALEAYRGKRVMISYEAADAQIGSGNYATSGGGGATRNDGRWLYSKNGENITSNIKIQYSVDNGKNYIDLDTTTPQVTGLSAYFTNDGVEGEMTYATTIDPDKTFDFEAKTENPDYKFVGWFMEDGTKITTDNASHTERSGSYTFVAKFMKVESGQLILSHKAVTDSTYTGSGNTTIAVRVENADGEVVRTFGATANDITLDDKIIKSDNTGYKIFVTLTATPSGEDTYAKTETTAAANFFDGAQSHTTMPGEFSFTVGDLFINTTQNVKRITYNTYFNQTKYVYEIKFQFDGRLAVNQSFTRKGTLTAKQRETYVTGEGATGTDRYLKYEFLNAIVPKETVLFKTIDWKFNEIPEANRKFTYNSTTNTYTLTKTYTADDTDNTPKFTATFKLSYTHDAYGYPTNTDSMPKTTEQNLVIENIPYGKIGKMEYDKLHDDNPANDPTYVTAPKALVDGGTTKYFQYWEVKPTTSDKVVAKCYTTRFNFAMLDNYVITPVYGGTETEGVKGTATSVSFMDTTRNQWNYNGYGGAKEITNANAQNASDLLFNDFVLSYSYDGVNELKYSTDSNIHVGFVVQRLDKLEKYSDGSPVLDLETYKTKYAAQDNNNAIKTFVTSGNKSGLNFDKIDIEKSKLDNKNRVQWYYSVYNSRGWKDDGTETPGTKYGYKNYVYRVYSYVQDAKGVTLSEEPVYFTMYEVASN